jgi:pimeloyl-ACP methyl ester carboxylesterase
MVRLRTRLVPTRQIAFGLCCAVWLLLAAGCATPVSVERVDAETVRREFTASALTADELSPSARNVLRRWVLSERYDSDPEGAIAALHIITVDGRGSADEVMTLAEMAFLYAENSQKRPYFLGVANSRKQPYYLAAAIYAFAFLFPEKESEAPSPYNPRLRLAADLYNLGLIKGFASADAVTVEIRNGSYELPFGRISVTFDPSALEWHNRRIVALTPVDELEIRGLTNRYHHAGIGAALAASTEPIVSERGMQVSPLMKLPMTALLRLDAPRRQLAQRQLRAELNLYNTQDVSTVTIAGRSVPLEADQTAVLAYVLASPQIWERELKAFFSGVFSEAAPTQLSSIDAYRPGRIPVVFVHGTASSAGRWADMVNDLLDDPRIRERYQFWFFTYDTGNPVLFSAVLLREALRDAVRKLDPAGRDLALSEMVIIGHSQGGLLAKAMAIDTGDRLWDAIAYKPIEQIDLAPEERDLLRRALFIKPLSNVRRVVFIATPHRGSFLTEFSAARLVGRFITLPARIVVLGARLATRNATDFKFDPDSLGTGSLLGMTPSNPVVQAMAATPVAPGIHANSIIAVAGSGPIDDGDDGVVEYKSAHLDGVESEYIVRSYHSTQSNPYTIEEVRRILLLHAADACTRIMCDQPSVRPRAPIAINSR